MGELAERKHEEQIIVEWPLGIFSFSMRKQNKIRPGFPVLIYDLCLEKYRNRYEYGFSAADKIVTAYTSANNRALLERSISSRQRKSIRQVKLFAAKCNACDSAYCHNLSDSAHLE